MRFKAAAIALAATTIFAAPAFAQDTQPRDEEPFTGAYIGVTAGYTVQPSRSGETTLFDRNLDGRFGDTVVTAAGANAFSPGFCNGRALGNNALAGCDTDRDGFEFSVRLGADQQVGNFVYGAVLEGGYTEATNSVTAFSTTPAAYEFNRELDYTASFRARAGFTPGPTTLFYGTFGGSYAKVSNSYRTTNTANSFSPLSQETDAFGWTAGGGVEQMIGRNFSIGLEYLYTDFREDDAHVVRIGPGTAPPTNPFLLAGAGGTDQVRSSNSFNLHSIRVTAAYRF